MTTRTKARLTVGIVLLAAGGLLWFGRYRLSSWMNANSPPRTYRIGWTDSPPFEISGADGQPTGFAVDLVRTAAARRGIRLQWVFWPRTSEVAFAEKAIDLWPVMTITPERLRHFYISEPYLETESCFLVRSDGPHVKIQDLATSTVSFYNRPVDVWELSQHLPNARRISRNQPSEVMDDMCTGHADVAFMTAFAGTEELLDKPGACRGVGMRWIAAPEILSHVGVAAAFEYRGVADTLRDEIGAMATEGKLEPILSESGYAAQQLSSIEALLNAKRRSQLLAWAAISFAVLFLVAFWQSLRILRERNRTRQAERARRNTEHKLSLMANNLKEMVLAYDMNKRLIFANPATRSLTGYEVAELESCGYVNWIHSDDQARMLRHWDQLFTGGSFEDEEYRMVTRDGGMKWVSATWGPLRDELGRQIGVQGSERDITDRKLVDEALRESEGRFRGILEHVQLPAAVYDLQGYFLFVNDYMLSISGWSREELLGHHVFEVMTPKDQGRVQKLIDSLALTGEPAYWVAEPELLTKDGKVRQLQVNNVVLRDAAGKMSSVASLGNDVTEYRALQEQYLMSQKLESLGTLAGGVAHDFNNLLTVINGYSNIVMRGLGEEDPARPKIEQIRKAGKQAAELTQQLLAFSRRQITQPRPVDLNTLLEESGEMFRSLLGENIELIIVPGHPLGMVMADPGQMHRVLMNLLVNARDAMPNGGKVSIRTHTINVTAESRQENPDVTPGPTVVLVVSDTGTGMDEQTRGRLFEPFFTTKEPGKGTGLGLSTVYGIVRQSGGWIAVRSAKGSGTSFSIHLPCIVDAEPEITARTVSPVSAPEDNVKPSSHITVLVVEDQEQVRSFVTAILDSLGYNTLSAANGDAALALASHHQGIIDLLLTDVILPGMNGKQLAEELKLVRPAVAILFTSGHPRNVIASSGVLYPEVAFIAKPYSPEELAAKLREVLAGAVSGRSVHSGS
jgi:PAS domain S-box-containing protein